MAMNNQTITDKGRRAALRLGLVAAATPVFGSLSTSEAQTYGSDEGKELLPGVRQVDLGKRESLIPGYKTVSMRDIVCQPGSHIPTFAMENDMVCHMTEGELRIVQDGKEFMAKKGDVWTCATGTEEGAWNEGNVIAIMRVIDLLPA